MARTRRIKFSDRDALHHVTSRISGRQMLLAGAGVKDDMLVALERAAEFSGVNVGAFAILDNHFHVVVQVPFHEGAVPEGEVLRRYGALMGEKALKRLEARLSGLRRGGGPAAAEAELDRLRARMHDLSQFVKTFKEEFGRLFRRRRPYPGTLWEGRFRSTLVGGAEYLRRCAAYVELNPVRAGLSSRADGYAWNTVGAARRGSAFAARCRKWLLSVLGLAGGDSPLGGGDSPLREAALARRVVQFSVGKILGSAAFVAQMLGVFAERVRSRSARAREVDGVGFASHGWRLAAKLSGAA
ncbi:MAG: hypothetical protein J6T51_06270 [Kiritimatiellae bacterium]|nr:hypothetical protein [Kiritimatiellia bacterium]